MSDSQPFIMVPVSVMESDVFKDAELLKLYMWCQYRASHSEHAREVIYDGKYRATVHPGEFLTGRSSGARELGWNASSFRNRLERLAASDLQLITVTAEPHFTRIHVIAVSEIVVSEIACSPSVQDSHLGQGKRTAEKDSRETADIEANQAESGHLSKTAKKAIVHGQPSRTQTIFKEELSRSQARVREGDSAPRPTPQQLGLTGWTPPTVEQIRELRDQHKLHLVDPDIFHAHYDLHDWMTGKLQMRSDQHVIKAMTAWHLRETKKPRNPQAKRPQTTVYREENNHDDQLAAMRQAMQ